MNVYLDFAAATPVDEAVLSAMQPYFSKDFYNPSALYLAAKHVKSAIEEARHSVGKTIGARPSEIIFTAGGTEANNLAINGVLQNFPGSSVVVSAIEHHSVLAAAEQHDHTMCPVRKDGTIDINALERAISDKTVLVSVGLVNNEIGTIQPIRDIVQVVQKVRDQRAAKNNTLPLLIHTDAAQATNYLDVNVSRLDVDLMTLNGGKIYGPKQSGMLYVKTGVILHPQIVGGGQERGVRSGTENVPAIIGFAHALARAQTKAKSEAHRISELRDYFLRSLQTTFPNVVVNGTQKQRIANNVHVTFPGQDNERMVMQLDEYGIMAAVGSACSASSDEPSHVLAAIGLPEADIRSSLRFTLGKTTTKKQIDYVVQKLHTFLG